MTIKQKNIRLGKFIIWLRAADELWYHEKEDIKHRMIFDLSICENSIIKDAKVLEITFLVFNVTIGWIKG